MENSTARKRGSRNERRLAEAAGEAVFAVRVTPRAARDEVAGWREGELLVHLTAPPLEGRANQSLRRLLALRLGVPASAVAVVTGPASRRKRVRVSGLSLAEVQRRLAVEGR
jgi:hypothetical protein